MKNRDSVSNPSVSSESRQQTLRQRAETIAKEKESHPPVAVDALPIEETQQKLHELLVHQIELEMQNDELRRAQTELEDARARYVDLYDLAPVGYCTITEKGLILEANLTAARLFGMVRGALIHQPISKFIYMEDQDAYYLHKRQLFSTGEPQDCEMRMTKRSGETFWAHMTAITLPNADGMPICRAALSDITDRKMKDEELKAIKDSLSAEIEALNDLHAISTQFIRQNNLQSIYEEILKASITMSHADKGIIQILDEQGRLKVFVQSGFGKPFLELLVNGSESGGSKAIRERKRVIAESVLGSPVFIGTPVLQAMLDERIETVQFTPMISGAGNILGVISTYHKTRHPFNERELRMFDLLARQGADVLERTRIEDALMQSERRALQLVEELRKADQNKNEFISMMSHELRNPLATIMVGISLLEFAVETEKSRGVKEIMKRQSEHLCRLVDDLLDLTRINMNKVKLKKERVELCKLARAVAEDFTAQFEKKGVTLETSTACDQLILEADSARLTQIIGNLLHNALKFTGAGGIVHLTLSKQETQAVICVEDNGIGIKPEILPDLFRPFVQLDNSIDRSNGGLGLGLSIVKGMAELHGGSANAFSEGLGKGARFNVLLPLCAEEIIEQGERQQGGIQTRSFRILCIEDNADFADLLCSMLELFGHTTVVAQNGIDGIERAKEFSPDIIFCDIGLPGMNGYEVAKCIRSDHSLANVLLIALTGYAGPRDIELAMSSGFHKHIPKPIDMDTLGRILSEVINQDIGS